MSISTVLSVGQNSTLLRVRSATLLSAGHHVATAPTIIEAAHRFQLVDFDLVLLCHSLSEKDRRRLISFIRASGSHTPIISVATNSTDIDDFADATAEDAPRKLLACVRRVLNAAEVGPSVREARFRHIGNTATKHNSIKLSQETCHG